MEQKQIIAEEEKGISLSDLFFLIKRNILLILIITGLFTVGGAVYGLRFKKITYTATSTAIVMVDSGTSSASGDYQNYLTSTYLINTFKDFIVSNNVVKQVIESPDCTKYDLTIKEINDNITISTSTNSLILTLKYSCADQDEAIKVLNKIVEMTIESANKLDENNDPVYKTLCGNFVVMDQADTQNTTASRGATLVIVICFLIGFIISFAIVLVKYLTDDTYTSKDDFERVYNINVLSLLPDISDYEKEGSKK